jgi:hypothetical protein
MPTEHEAQVVYQCAIRRALEHLHESERLCARIDAVATSLNDRRWPWSTNPAAALRTL